jgi:hypothetical protein
MNIVTENKNRSIYSHSYIYILYKITIDETIKTNLIDNLEIQSIKIKISIIIELILEIIYSINNLYQL